jgi:hypothetical protein
MASRTGRWLGVGLVSAGLIGGAALSGGRDGGGVQAASAAPTTVRVNAGGYALTDADGRRWEADSGFTGGSIYTTHAAVVGEAPAVLQSEHYAMTSFSHALANGHYQVRLHEAEIWFDSPGKRVFSVTAQGATVVRDHDIFAHVGKNRGETLSFPVTVSNGRLQLGFSASVNHPKVDGIEILPVASPTPSATATAHPSPTATVIPPTPSHTATPRPTPTATPTPTPTPTVSPPAGHAMIIGAENANFSGTNIAGFMSMNQAVGPLRVRRSFSTGLPTNIEQTEAAGDHAAGITNFFSVKANPAEVAAGKHDAEIAALARSMYDGDYLTMYHEPENDMNGPTYVAMFRQFYRAAKAARPGLYVGNIYMSYQWAAGKPSTANPDSWWVGAGSTDFLAIDSYWQAWRGAQPLSLGQDPWQLRWHNWASTKGKPLLVTENGIDASMPDAARAAYIAGSEGWLRSHGYQMWLYWNGSTRTCCGMVGGAGSFPLMAAAWRVIASRGRSDTHLM